MLGAFWKRQAEGNTDRKRIGIYEGKHTFREEAGRGAGGGGGVWQVRGPPGPPDQPNKRAGGGGRKAPAPLPVQGAKRPAAAPPRRPLGNRPRQKGGRFAGLGDGSRLPGGLLVVVRRGGGGVRRPGRGGGGLGSGPPEGEYAPLIA